MPGGDGTGPMGMGPMTGRGGGFCAGFGMPGFANRAPRFGCFGRGRRRRGGRGWQNMFYATGLTGWQRAAMGTLAAGAGLAAGMTNEQEATALEQQADDLAGALDALRKRIDQIQSQPFQPK